MLSLADALSWAIQNTDCRMSRNSPCTGWLSQKQQQIIDCLRRNLATTSIAFALLLKIA
jgi:hypothetical protein